MKQQAETDNIPQPLATCSDGIMNQGETDIDCGGPCPACLGNITALANGDTFNSTAGTISSFYNNNTLYMTGTASIGTLSLIYQGPLVTGTYSNCQGLFTKSSNSQSYTTSNATITFTSFNTADSVAAGTFNFDGVCLSCVPTDSVHITSGQFKRISFKKN
ncbi:MAG: hypothetical protein JSS90_07200 [Bacteroidetes bacterium]|jgi:hypothetical protein|nr:hypothetical protein [Bacteroidota bacterium]